MAERWQSAEARVAAVFFRDSSGSPVTGLTPSASVLHKDGTGSAPTATVAEVGSGFYRVTLSAAPSKDLLVRVDGGASLSSTRYVALEVPVGGYVDSIDATTSSRASQASVTALGSPAQASALATVQADTDDIQATLAANLDATVSSRASQASVTALGSPAQASALAAVQADTDDLQASLTTVLARLDVAVSTRASAADMASALADLATVLSRVDVATSTRASASSLATLSGDVASLTSAVGSPAQASALATLASAVGTPAQAAALASLAASVGTPAQAAALTSAYLDLLANILTRATPDDVQVTVEGTATITPDVRSS